jgi:hypothetical protein
MGPITLAVPPSSRHQRLHERSSILSSVHRNPVGAKWWFASLWNCQIFLFLAHAAFESFGIPWVRFVDEASLFRVMKRCQPEDYITKFFPRLAGRLPSSNASLRDIACVDAIDVQRKGFDTFARMLHPVFQ